MPRTKGAKKKTVKATTTKKSKSNCHCGPGYECKCKSKTKRKVKSKTEQIKTPVLNPFSALSRGTSQNLGFHPVGLVNNQMQQPTVVQQITPAPDPRLEKLEKRTKKIKEYLKGKGDTKENPINVESPSFQDAFKTPAKPGQKLIFEDAVEEEIPIKKPEKRPNFIRRLLFSSSSKKEKSDAIITAASSNTPYLIEYESLQPFQKPKPTAPAFTQTESIETQTTPVLTGHVINQELKNLVNQLLVSHGNKTKMKIGPFRSAIAKKLKDLGVEQQHTTTYVDKMRKFYDELWAASYDIEET